MRLFGAQPGFRPLRSPSPASMTTLRRQPVLPGMSEPWPFASMIIPRPLQPENRARPVRKGRLLRSLLPTGLGSGEQNDGLGRRIPGARCRPWYWKRGGPLESTVLLEFIEERWPEPRLPLGPGPGPGAHDRGGYGYALRGDQLGPGEIHSLGAAMAPSAPSFWPAPKPTSSSGTPGSRPSWGTPCGSAGNASAGRCFRTAPPPGQRSLRPRAGATAGWALIGAGPGAAQRSGGAGNCSPGERRR